MAYLVSVECVQIFHSMPKFIPYVLATCCFAEVSLGSCAYHVYDDYTLTCLFFTNS